MIENDNPASVTVPRCQSEMKGRMTDVRNRNSPQIGNNFSFPLVFIDIYVFMYYILRVPNLVIYFFLKSDVIKEPKQPFKIGGLPSGHSSNCA